jgi:tetratricopeptide (TPR) repeat protein
MAYRSMINTMRNATLNCNNAESSSMLLRNFLVDPKVDTAVNDAAKEMFNQAEKQFQSNNFGKAAELYQKAIDIQPNYFKASLYLGDSYYAMKNYREAINYFKRSVESFPTMLEPRKYLSDAYNGEGLYNKAIEEGINALCIYPDQNMYIKVRDLIARHENKLLPRQLVRVVYPISKETSSGEIPGEFTDEEQSKLLKKQADYWEYYSAAGKNLKDKFDTKGINSSNNGERYLELACWKEMLKYSQAPELETARKMKALGMLDCYVFITCFHHDIYDQYHDFASLNKEKIKSYFEKASFPR